MYQGFPGPGTYRKSNNRRLPDPTCPNRIERNFTPFYEPKRFKNGSNQTADEPWILQPLYDHFIMLIAVVHMQVHTSPWKCPVLTITEHLAEVFLKLSRDLLLIMRAAERFTDETERFVPVGDRKKKTHFVQNMYPALSEFCTFCSLFSIIELFKWWQYENITFLTLTGKGFP